MDAEPSSRLHSFVETRRTEILGLSRWARAYWATRLARLAAEVVDGAKVSPTFGSVLATLDAAEEAVESGTELLFPRGNHSPARRYADDNHHSFNKSADVLAALAVDDACGLLTRAALSGRARESGEQYQLRKLSFALSCAIQAAQQSGVDPEAIIADAIASVECLQRTFAQNPQLRDQGFFAKNCLALNSTFENNAEILEVGSEINARLVALLRRNPALILTLQPRAFEELIAHLFSEFGYTVQLTSRTRDGGRDVIAIENRIARTKYLIECKKYKDKKVGIEIVQRLHGVVAGDDATLGILATTSSFTRDASNFLARPSVEYRLTGTDFSGIQAWLQLYERETRLKRLLRREFEITDSGLIIPA